jgi:hypothetical protein
MKINALFAIIAVSLMSCTGGMNEKQSKQFPAITGTWRLITGTLIEKGDTLVTHYDNNVSFIKIINNTHFAFLQHDLKKGKDSAALFVAGGGRYSLTDSTYTEHLEYCSARNWEGNDFKFNVSVKGDTLIQSGIEKIESEGVNRINIEKYIRVPAESTLK